MRNVTNLWVFLTVAIGCILIFPARIFPHETLTTTVLFDREIVRILNKHCVMCHVENGPSFPIETYEQTWLQGRKIRSEVIARHMPIWPAVSGYNEFANDNSLTLRETQFLVSWVEGLGPRNSGTVFTNVVDASGKPRTAVRARADFSRWQLGQPDMTVPFGPAKSDRIVLDLGFKQPQRIRAIEYMPADRRAVHAATFTIQETGQRIGAWTPWYGFMELPSGVAFQLPAGAHVVAELHYGGAKQSSVDGGTLGLFFAERAAGTKITSDLTIGTKDTGKDQRFRGDIKISTDTRVVAIYVNNSSSKSVEVSAHRPDGGTDVLLFAKDFSRDWPTPYIFKKPVLLRPGTVLSVTSYGSAENVIISRY